MLMVIHKRNLPEHTNAISSGLEHGCHLHLPLASPQLCLDYANTFGSRLASQRREPFTGYQDLLTWCQEAGILTAAFADRLRQHSAQHAVQGTTALTRAIHLREAIYRLFSASTDGGVAVIDNLAILNETLTEALTAMRVSRTEDGYRWAWDTAEVACNQVLWPVALSTASLLTSSRLRLVRQCAAPDCAWLFLDTTRNRSRRWCDMKVCGNRAKARRHYERQKKAGKEADIDSGR
jgi:predicted RNA-binding Zn ribbon-like protein